MHRSKKKIIGGREYRVQGSTIEYEGFRVVQKSYSTTAGKVTVKNGIVTHPNGEQTKEWG